MPILAKLSSRKSQPNYILAIDQGTTGSTVALVDSRGNLVAESDNDFKQIYPKPGWVEHRPDDIWRSVMDAMRDCLRKGKIKPTQIAAIGITNQRETVLFWDRKNAKPVMNAIVWQDRRTSDRCTELKQNGDSKQIQEITGLVTDPYFSGTKIEWMLKNVPGLGSKAESGKVICGNIDTFILWKLTGVHKTDVSNASRTMLMDLKTTSWSDDLLKLFKIPKNILPEICDSSGVFGTTKNLKILPDGIPVCGIAGDQQAALFGQSAFQAGDAKCTFGTGSFILMNSGNELLRSKSGLLTTVAWRLPKSNTTYALEGGAFICGAAVQFLRDQMQFIKRSEEVEHLARKVKSTEGVEFVPALTGIGAPHWDPEARGIICGLTRGSTREHIARATLEAMALQNAEILIAMKQDLNRNFSSLRVDGGASANNLLMQLQADYLGTTVIRPKMIETTVAGAAYLAGLGVGLFSDLDEIKKVWRVDKEFHPALATEARAERLLRWQKAIKRALI